MTVVEQSPNSEAVAPLVSVALPALNEASRQVTDSRFGLAACLADGHQTLRREFGAAYELVVIDDGSKDDTASFALAHGAHRVISYPQNHGRGYALRTGLPQLRGAFVGWADADNSYAWDDILRVAKPVLEGRTDIAIATRSNRLRDHEGLRRAVGHWLVRNTAELIVPVGLPDTQGGLQFYTAAAMRTVWPQVIAERWGANREAVALAQRAGLKVEAVPARPTAVEDSRVHLMKGTVRIIHEALTTRRYLRENLFQPAEIHVSASLFEQTMFK